MKETSKPDWFARITAIIGLLIACAAILIPLYQSKIDSQEALSITAIPETGGIIKLSNNLNKSQAVQIPWIITLTNTGKVTLSITSYTVEQIAGQGIRLFAGLNGGATDGSNNFFPFPQTLEAGHSVAFRLHIGFIPTKDVQQKLWTMYLKEKPINYNTAFVGLAKEGLTLYGGQAEYKEYPGGSYLISIDPSSYKSEPIYRITFTSGRGNATTITTSEMLAKSQQIKQ